MTCLNLCFLSYVSYFSSLLYYSGFCLLLARAYFCVFGLSPLSMLDWQLTDAVVPLPPLLVDGSEPVGSRGVRCPSKYM